MPLIKNVPENVIKFIVDKRNDKSVKNTYPMIAEMVKAEFGISMTQQNVHYHFKHNKDKGFIENSDKNDLPASQDNLANVKSNQVVNLPITEELSKEEINISSSVAKPKKIDFKALRQSRASQVEEGFDKKFGDNLSEEELSSLLGKAK